MKEQFAILKKDNPAMEIGQIMKLVGEGYRKQKEEKARPPRIENPQQLKQDSVAKIAEDLEAMTFGGV